jgi:hypothetical protein
MGGFATLLGAAGIERSDLERALRPSASEQRWKFSRGSSGLMSPRSLVITPGEAGRWSVLFPEAFDGAEQLARSVSKILQAPLFLFHIHDGDFWMYSLYSDGKEVDHFNPIPDYWGDVGPTKQARWAGSARQVARYWPGLKPAMIEKYLVPWDLDSPKPKKAYPSDAYAYGDWYQLGDFMRRLGLIFPLDAEPVSSTPEKAARRPPKNRWEAAWADALTLKTAAARREALEVLRQAPLDVVFRLARKNRQLISRTRALPDEHGSSERYFFAGSRRRNVMKDVVEIDVLCWRRRIRIEQILICHEMAVHRARDGYYDIRESVLAAAGHDGGARVVNFNAYLYLGDPPTFRDEIERDLPQIKR